jgi:hypothetical protein
MAGSGVLGIALFVKQLHQALSDLRLGLTRAELGNEPSNQALKAGV